MGSPMNGMLYAHKAIRRELDGLENEARSLDTTNRGQIVQLAERLRVFRAAVEGHNAGEEAELWPAIEDKFPQISIPYTLDHRADEVVFDALKGLLVHIERVQDDPQREELARRLNRQFIALNVTVTHHSRKEDAHLIPLVQEHFSIPEQGGLSGRMASRLPRELMPKIVPMVMQALELDERVDYITMVKPGMPPEAFQAMAGWVRASLPADEWTELVARIPELSSAG